MAFLGKASPKLPRDYAERAFASFGSKTRKMVLRYYRYLDSKRLVGWDVRLIEDPQRIVSHLAAFARP
jgi:hypothetical protein